MKLRELVQSDLARYVQTYRLRRQPFLERKVFWESLLFKAGFQAVLLYRISHWFFQKGWIYGAWALTRLNLWLTGAEIEFNARIGPGFFIAHPVGIVIGRGTELGEGVTLFQGVSFVAKSWHPNEIGRFPKAGKRCYFFAHSLMLGSITIGDDCVVAAGGVVTKDVPDGALARGVPAQIYPDEGRRSIESWTQEN
jgi:serine O-acetyltransferase